MTLSPATRLLLLTAAVPPRDAAIRELVDGPIDWAELGALAQHEKSAAIVLRHLGRARPAESDAGYGDLRQLATVAVMRVLQLEQALHRTLDTLAQEGIAVLLLKGAGLAYTVYASFDDRPMGDLDLLIPPQDARRAWSLLQAQGWTWPESQWGADRYTAHQHLPPLLQNAGGARLEIHTDMLPEGHPFRMSPDTLWTRAQRLTRNGRVLTIPHPIHQLWHVCVHFAWSHEMLWGAWRALRDSAAIIQQGEFDWTEFVDLARDSRAATSCYWTLRLARHLVGAAVPDQVLAALRPPRRELLLEWLERHYASNLFPSKDGCPSVWLTRRLWEAGMLPGWSGHGDTRPWHVAERWEAGAGQSAPETTHAPLSPGSSPWRTIKAWAAYFQRLRRF